MRVIARVERPHPGAQLRITDPDGNRVTAFATNTRPGGPAGQIADLELRHRRRARCEDRIRAAKDTGLTNLPLHGFDQNRIWCAVVQLACELIAWTQMLGLANHPARRWEPKRCGCGCSPRPGASLITPTSSCCTSAPIIAGPNWCSPAEGHRPLRTADPRHPTLRTRNPDRPVDPAAPPESGSAVMPVGRIQPRERPPSHERSPTARSRRIQARSWKRQVRPLTGLDRCQLLSGSGPG